MRIYLFLFYLLALPAVSFSSEVNTQQLLQLIDYVGVDYGEAVKDGKIINEEEFDEMQEFSEAIASKVQNLPSTDAIGTLQDQANTLTGMITRLETAEKVSRLTAQMRQQLIDGLDIVVTPQLAPDLAAAASLYNDNCASCHGTEGRGDGPLAAALEPAPTDFRDRERYLQRTLYGLYNTITQGVDGTGMKPFAELSEHERWSLAFYTGGLATDLTEQQQGGLLWQKAGDRSLISNIESLTTWTPAQMGQEFGDEGLALMAFLRHQPEMLFEQQMAPLVYSQRRLRESLELVRAGAFEQAHTVAVDAYLEGFELVENSLDSLDHELRLTIEQMMTDYRNQIRNQATLSEIEGHVEELIGMLGQAQGRLESTTLSPEAAFSGAFVILLREGLEALLVVAALAAFLIKTGRRDGLPHLFGGVGLALLLGGLTWLASVTVVDISGAQRELTEGYAALFAAIVLFYVGFWLHGKSSAEQWRHFIEGSIKKALSKGTLWGLAALSFIAVYREMFETILFYQALWLQADQTGQGMIVSGLLFAAALLAVLAWLLLRYSTRLPLRQFFAVTGLFMFLLAIIFAGKGVAALQEAGKLTLNPVAFPRIELLGIYPNLEGLAVQATMLVLALGLLFSNRLFKRPAEAKVRS